MQTVNIHYPERMIQWRLRETLEARNVSRYALQKESGVAMNTIREMWDGNTRRPDLRVLDKLIDALEKITGKRPTLSDFIADLERQV
jgi:DNA-binding Xre family transcriptional regulator